MTDWIEHDGGPQPVADDVWVQWLDYDEDPHGADGCPAQHVRWAKKGYHRIINQHLIDAALKRGIELGLEAAAKEADRGSWSIDGEWRKGGRADNYLQGQSDGMDEAARLIRALDPKTIAREAVLDQLANEAQTQDMGYPKETAR
jgi:hypothetical protein